MNLTIIVAVSENNVIGKDGKVPWYIPEDLKRFRELTKDHPVIMGRKTYESLPEKYKPLPHRKNIVLSDTLNLNNGVHIARTPYEAIYLTNCEDSYIIGGEKVYKLFLPLSNKLEITRVDGKWEGDAFFPSINWTEWRSIGCSGIRRSENEINYFFQTYERVANNPKS